MVAGWGRQALRFGICFLATEGQQVLNALKLNELLTSMQLNLMGFPGCQLTPNKATHVRCEKPPT